MLRKGASQYISLKFQAIGCSACAVTAFFCNSANSISAVYIDGTDVALEGTFRSSGTGALLPYANWNSGEPNNCCGGEHCLNMWGYTGRWNDLTCAAAIPSICEIEGKHM